MKRKLIVLEGPDNVGKSTQVEVIKTLLNAKQIRQPSGENSLGFLRDVVKNNVDIDPFPRQLLHTASHIVDAFTEFGDSNIIMDRCHASTYIYGQVTGMTEYQNELLLKIHQNVYNSTLSLNFDITVIFLDRDARISSELTDKFETTFDWNTLRDLYRDFHSKMVDPDRFLFSNTEKVTLLNNTLLTREETTETIMSIINDH